MPFEDMIVYDHAGKRFCYRVAAVIIDQDRVLLQAIDEPSRALPKDVPWAPFWCLPGGRMELGEASAECLKREMREELGEEVRIERLLWVVENFFEHEGLSWHEIGLYFLVSLPQEAKLLVGEGPFVGVEEEAGIEFRLEWHPLSELDDVRLYPSFLKSGLNTLPEHIEHLVHRDE